MGIREDWRNRLIHITIQRILGWNALGTLRLEWRNRLIHITIQRILGWNALGKLRLEWIDSHHHCRGSWVGDIEEKPIDSHHHCDYSEDLGLRWIWCFAEIEGKRLS